MFERFTDRARRTVVLAQEEARRLNHNYIGTEHLLLGLVAEPSTLAGEVLGQLGIGLDVVRVQVEDIIGRGDIAPSGHIPFTPRAKKVLELSLREALSVSHNYIGTEHILLGIIREGEGVAAQVLVTRGAQLDQVRQAIVQRIEAGIESVPFRARLGHRRARTPAADEVISAAERLAGGGPVGSHHLLEALARSEGSMAAGVFADLGVDPERITEALDRVEVEETTDTTPEEGGARHMELRVEGEEVHVILRDRESLSLARSVVEEAGGPVYGNDPVAGAFVGLWSAVTDMLIGLLASLKPEPMEAEPPGGRSLLVQRVIQSRLARRRRRPRVEPPQP